MLGANEPTAVTIERADGQSVFFITVDHASNRIPEALGDLGIPLHERERHIAWDIGALGVARNLSQAFDACLVTTNYSRLVIDCNRDPAREDSIPALSESTVIPGNCGLSVEAKVQRRNVFWEPYHRTIGGLLAARFNRPTLYIAIHSFTPVYKGESRPWHIALLSNRDRRVAEILLRELPRDPALCVGDNTPYRLTDEGDYGVPVHAERQGLPHVLIEIRQDQIADPAGQRVWAARLQPLLELAANELGQRT